MEVTMIKTIISAVGRGTRDLAGTVYQRTIYEFQGEKFPPTPFFVDSIRRKYRPQHIALVGTRTSSWGAVVEEYSSDDSDLWLALENATEARPPAGVDDGLLDRLAALLSAKWDCHVTCAALCKREIDDTNAAGILAKFIEMLPLYDPEQEIVLDMTHAFRTLPMLAFSAIQIGEAFAPGLFARTRLVYADLVRHPASMGVPPREGEPIGQGRGVALESIREFAEVAHAAVTFENTLDPEPLSRILARKGCPKLAHALERFGIALASNAFSRLNERISELRNALAQSQLQHLPYANLLRQRLLRFADILDQPDLPRQLVALANQRADRRDYALAVLALSEAVPGRIGHYWTNPPTDPDVSN